MKRRTRSSAGKGARVLGVVLAVVAAACGGSPDEDPAPSPNESTPDEPTELPPPEDEASAEPEVEIADWGDASPAVQEAFRVTGQSQVVDDGRRFPRLIEHATTGLAFCYVHGGAFTLGSPFGEEGRFLDEDPPRRVRMTGFYVSRTEVTYAAWLAGGGRKILGNTEDHPVTGLTWYEARDWCAKNGFSLPSEAQWEYAASGTGDDTFPGGYEPDMRLCNAQGRSDYDHWTESSPAGAIPTDLSWCGAFDMAGNVMEWCRDGWLPSYESIPDGAVDPVRAVDEEAPALERVVRGGSYFSKTTDHLRTAYRRDALPNDVGANLGFRVVVGR